MVSNDVDSIEHSAAAEIKEIEEKAAAEIKAIQDTADAAGGEEGEKKAQEFRQKLSTYGVTLQENHSAQVLEAAFQYASAAFDGLLVKKPDVVLGIAKTVLGSIPEIANVWLRVNPLDLPILKSGMSEILEAIGHQDPIELREDARLDRGGVIVHSEAGVMDAQPKTQLAELKRLLGAQEQIQLPTKQAGA